MTVEMQAEGCSRGGEGVRVLLAGAAGAKATRAQPGKRQEHMAAAGCSRRRKITVQHRLVSSTVEVQRSA